MLKWPSRHCWISRCTFLKHIQLGRTIPWFRSQIRYIAVVYPWIWCVLDNINFIVTFIYLCKYGLLRPSIKWLGPNYIQHSPPLKQSKQTKKVAKKAKTGQSFAVPNKNFLPLIFYAIVGGITFLFTRYFHFRNVMKTFVSRNVKEAFQILFFFSDFVRKNFTQKDFRWFLCIFSKVKKGPKRP